MVTNNSCDYSPTQYNVQTGGANGTLNDVSPSTSGFILTSNGVAAQPTFQAPAGSSITIAGDTGSHTGSSFTFNGPTGGGKTVSFAVSGSTVDWKAGDSGNNVAIGPSAGPVTYSGTSNTALGNLAQASTTISGSSNTSVGDSTLSTLSTGSNNTAVGISSCHSLTTGHENTAYGRSSLNALTTGVDNIAIGNVAGSNYFTSESNNIVIGNSGTTAESNVIRIGVQGSGSGQQSTCYIAGIEGVSVSNKNIVTIDTTSGQLGSDATVAVAQGGTGASSFNINGVVISNTTTTGALASLTLTNGQVVIGSTGNPPAAATLTAGSGITITNAANSITIATTGGAFPWTDVTGATQTLAINNAYVTDRSGGVTYTLPSTASLGDTIKIVGKAGLATITPNANQQILIGTTSGTVGATGTAAANNAGDCITMVCTTAGASTVWRAETTMGTWTLS